MRMSNWVWYVGLVSAACVAKSFPKDVQAFHAVASQWNYDFGLLTEVMRINGEQAPPICEEG